MSNSLLIKNKSVSGTIPAVSALSAAEIAINTADGILFTKNIAGVVLALPFGALQSTLTYSLSSNIDFSLNGLFTLSLTGNVTFTTSNKAPNRGATILITSDSSIRNLTFPSSWKWFTTMPTATTASKSSILTLQSLSTSESDVWATYIAQTN